MTSNRDMLKSHSIMTGHPIKHIQTRKSQGTAAHMIIMQILSSQSMFNCNECITALTALIVVAVEKWSCILGVVLSLTGNRQLLYRHIKSPLNLGRKTLNRDNVHHITVVDRKLR